MDSTKYVGMDVHTEAISVAVRNSAGKVIMESILETKANTILEFLQGLRGNVHVTFEEGTWAAWLYDLLKPHVTKVLVCNPRKNALLKDGNKGDKIDARKLSELLRLNHLKPVYHGEHGIRALWNCGLGIETHDSAQYRFVRGELQRSKRPQQLRGLNKNHNHDLKKIFKSAATMATISAGPFHDFYEALLVK